jgi:repressor LexA
MSSLYPAKSPAKQGNVNTVDEANKASSRLKCINRCYLVASLISTAVIIDEPSQSNQARKVEAAYTETQGQYLAFIYYYTKIHGMPPAEADFQRYFKTSPPTIHQTIVTLDKRGFIERTPGVGRSIRLRLSRDQLPDLL